MLGPVEDVVHFDEGVACVLTVQAQDLPSDYKGRWTAGETVDIWIIVWTCTLEKDHKYTSRQLEDGILGDAHCREVYGTGWAGEESGLPHSTTSPEELAKNKLEHMANVERLKNFNPTFVDPKLQEQAAARDKEAQKAYHEWAPSEYC